LYYTASGIITPVGGSPVHRLRVLIWLSICRCPSLEGHLQFVQCMLTSPESFSAQTAIISPNAINLLPYMMVVMNPVAEVRSSGRVLTAALYRSAGPDLRFSYDASVFTVK